MDRDMSTPEPSLDQPDAPHLHRRRVLAQLSLALGGIGAVLVGLPVIGFLVAPLFRPNTGLWRAVGATDQFKIGETVEVTMLDASPVPWAGIAAKTGAWLRRESVDSFVAFTLNCSHLGCPVRWLPDADLFMCPCHGGVFYKDGRKASGPPPRGLARYPARVRHGQVEIQLSPVPIEGLPTTPKG